MRLAVDAIARRREGLLKHRVAEASRARELALAIYVNSSLFQYMATMGGMCRNGLRDILDCSGCVGQGRQLLQTSLRVSDGTWEIVPAGLCEHRDTKQLVLAAMRHMRACRRCKPAEMNLAEHVERAYPGSLRQPLRNYESISWMTDELFNAFDDLYRGPRLTMEAVPHLHACDCGCPLLRRPATGCKFAEQRLACGPCIV